MIIRALIVDDEALARERLRRLLEREPQLQVIGECANGPEAIKSICESRPDLVFLDVQMPEVSGFDVLRSLLPELWPAVIFVTAHDQHAVEAFEINALDYLLKPFTQARLAGAIQRARRHLEQRGAAKLSPQILERLAPASAKPAYLTRVTVKTGNQTLFVKVEDIDYAESAANYVVIQSHGETHTVRETLSNLEASLPPHLFLRISRTTIVNLERIKSIQNEPKGEYFIVLSNGRKLPMTRGLREVQAKLEYPGASPGGQ